MAPAIESPGNAPVSSPSQYLTFELGDEMFAVGTLNVREIIEYGPITSVPLLPPSIRGVINLRGAAVPVLDLGVRFRGERTVQTSRTCFVIIEVQASTLRKPVGIIVDAVSEVLEIADHDIEPSLNFGTDVRADFLLGIGKLESGFVLLLDIGRVLSLEQVDALVNLESPLPSTA
ncbi:MULTISPECIES: chemotaxis protein CheW [unclassified Pseudomonas]|uniref:chemotaxis protein CheW n=1 Tax=unclassified Pseudomonas TaxID=196821 RepID=UPI0014728003|nr:MULTISPECIES: chemotaxis protein CheW [unclassified Pseudomonas]NMX93424.1 purine-binding chemotaxis protein CheW [Pseudomonas sp. WS 5086]NMY48264.1 purine-binding chemotaxis protein CheW [Pseudomonas sp. WS 5027]